MMIDLFLIDFMWNKLKFQMNYKQIGVRVFSNYYILIKLMLLEQKYILK